MHQDCSQSEFIGTPPCISMSNVQKLLARRSSSRLIANASSVEPEHRQPPISFTPRVRRAQGWRKFNPFLYPFPENGESETMTGTVRPERAPGWRAVHGTYRRRFEKMWQVLPRPEGANTRVLRSLSTSCRVPTCTTKIHFAAMPSQECNWMCHDGWP